MNSHRSYSPHNTLALLVCLALAPRPANAQATPASRPPALSAALRTLPADALRGSVVLAVSPERIHSLRKKPADPGTATPDTPLSDAPALDLNGIAARYDCVQDWFGAVCAVAPSTMTVLNTSPTLAALPLAALARQHPETYLLGLLTPDQLRQVGADGLAYADMTPDQQSLMHDLLPEPLAIVPADADPGNFHMDPADRKAMRSAFDKQIRKVGGNELFGALRLHAYLTTDFYVHAPTGFGIGDTRDALATTGAYKLPFGGYRNMDARSKDTNNVLSADMPNAPKPGDLAWDRRELARPVALTGLKTVDDLTARLAQATGLELYADAHYGPQTVLAVGSLAKTPPAGDVMQALALCVCGTWRKVGPAYVLTDDVAGLGTRQQELAEIGQIWSNRLTQAGKDASAHLQVLDWLHALSFAPGDPGALSAAQIAAIHKAAGGSKGTLPWGDLPSALRERLRDHFLHYGDDMPKSVRDPELTRLADGMKAAGASVRPDSPVDATLNIRLAVEMPDTGAMMLYDEYRVQTPEPSLFDAAKAAAKAGAAVPSPSLPPAGPVRALWCAPATPDEARDAVAAGSDMGLNTLMVDVFTNGRTSFTNSAMPPTAPDAAGMLQAALDAARPRHIPVYAVVDTLCWRKDGLAAHPLPWPVGYGEDLTVTGETLGRAIQRRVEAGSFSVAYDHAQRMLTTTGTQGWASPLDPAVRALLPALVKALAATPGLAGVVFQDTVPPGYRKKESNADGTGLGYTPQNRLTYLRRTHHDPVDLSSGYDMVSVFVAGEDFFGGYPIDISTFPSARSDYDAWTKTRADADSALLTDCWAAARILVPNMPLLRREGLFTSGFVPWLKPDQPETESLPTPDHPLPSLPPGSLVVIPFDPQQPLPPQRLFEMMQAASHPEEFAGGAAASAVPDIGGIVLDLTTDDPTPGGLHESLRLLRSSLPPPSPKPGQ